MEELMQFRALLAKQLEESFRNSPYGKVVVSFKTEAPPKPGVTYTISSLRSSMADQYRYWTESREPPLFGAHPDRKVTGLAAKLLPPVDHPILDIGGGTGRNALPLARAGHPVDVVEMSPALAEILEGAVAKDELEVRVYREDFLAPDFSLEKDHYALAILSEVVSHFRTVDELRTLFERLAKVLRPNGLVAINLFLTYPGYDPDAMAREMGELAWSTIYTIDQVKKALEGLTLKVLSDEIVYDYERRFTPPAEWPPTGWYETWTLGLDIFSLPGRASPVEMHWLVLRKM